MNKICLVLAAALYPYSALSGPDKTTEYFMDTPATLWDLGIYKMNQIFDHWYNLSETGREVIVGYDWDSDDIQIIMLGVHIEGVEISKEPVTVEECKRFVNSVRTSGGYDNGKLAYLKVSRYAREFLHSGFIKGEQAEHDERIQELEKKFVAICHAGPTTKVIGRIDGTEFLIQDAEEKQ